MRRRHALLALLLVAGACDGGDTASPRTAGSPTTTAPRLVNGGGPVLDGSTTDGRVRSEGDGVVAITCSSILDWTYELVGAVNGFTRVSRDLASPDERRAEYLRRFDEAVQLTEELIAALGALPAAGPWAAVREGLVGAGQRARQTLVDGRAHAGTLTDEHYAVLRVRSGSLFVDSEKARAQVFRALKLAALDGHPELGHPCGRPRLPGDQAPAG